MKILILEDSLDRKEAFRKYLTNHQLYITDIVSRAHAELRAAYEDGRAYDVVMLDNDLGEGFDEGRKLADLIKRDFVDGYVYTELIRKIFVHSSNIVAAQAMVQTLRRNVDIEHIPFSSFPLQALNEVN
jgi:CheY-like chemotaxis protein